MFTTHFGLWGIFLLCCCNKSQAKLYLKNRTSVALAGNTTIHQLKVNIPANSTERSIKCYHNRHQVWERSLKYKSSPQPQEIDCLANIIMHNSSCSGEYYFEYMKEKVYWVILVRDVGYQPDKESSVVPLLVVVVIIVLLLVSVTGSVYIFKWYKNNSSSKEDGVKVKAKKPKRNTVVIKEEAKSDSVYTALEHKTVSVYDMLNVDKARRASTGSQTSKKKANPSTVEEGILESVYENL